MSINRRNFMINLGIGVLSATMPKAIASESPQLISVSNSLIKPPCLKVGDTVGLINPASYIEPKDVDEVTKTLASLGLKVKPGKHILDRYGYLSGTDTNRAADVNQMFADNSVQAIIAMRGGWGCNRILPLLDYSLMRSHPKIIMGYSDITSLLLAIYTQTNLVTFHGPVATSKWNAFTVDYVKRILFNGEATTMQNPVNMGVQTIVPGKARGRLIGGNLSVLVATIGSAYLPAWENTILFIEEIGEEPYRLDRMLTHLKLSGILNKISGFIFGNCTNCRPQGKDESLTLTQILTDLIQPLGIPAWYGSPIGHIPDKFTVPIGLEVEIDAIAGTIKMLEPAALKLTTR